LGVQALPLFRSLSDMVFVVDGLSFLPPERRKGGLRP
jgi:hypothetical protein